MYQQIIAAFERENALTESTKKLALLLAGLNSPGDSVTSLPLGKSEMETFRVDFRQKLALVREQVIKLVDAQSKPKRFVTKAAPINAETTRTNCCATPWRTQCFRDSVGGEKTAMITVST